MLSREDIVHKLKELDARVKSVERAVETDRAIKEMQATLSTLVAIVSEHFSPPPRHKPPLSHRGGGGPHETRCGFPGPSDTIALSCSGVPPNIRSL